VNPNAELVDANPSACHFVGKEFEEIQGHLMGEVMPCIHSFHSHGCGKTVHCKACAIRKAVTTTFLTGNPAFEVDSYHDIMTKDGQKRVHLKVSTMKKWDTILLKLVEA
jgi:PAS domain-containing protein